MTISWHVEQYERVESTQDLLKQKIEEGAQEGLVVVAEEQTKGHGRHGREWVSPAGNVYMSVLLRPVCSVQKVGQLSLLSGLSIFQAVEDLDPDIELKWPNDVLLRGKKCAGLILETEMQDDCIEWLALGIGINVESAPGIGECFGKGSIEVASLVERVLERLGFYYDVWQSGGFQNIAENWLWHAHPVGSKMEIKLGNSREQGYFHGLDDNGNLYLQNDNNEIRTITAGDVYLV